jgi:hypothetical protein
MTNTIRARLTSLFPGPEKERLRQGIDEAWADFDHQIRCYGRKRLETSWAQSAVHNLLDAEQKLAAGKTAPGWISTHAAQRAILSNPENPERAVRAAVALRREKEKVTGWRANVITDLIGDSNGCTPVDIAKHQRHIVEALAVRDDYFRNNYFKISLRRRHLIQVACFLWFGILACVVASYRGVLPPPYDDRQQVLLVVLFGILGACLSVAQGLLASDVSARIPAQQTGAFVVWVRPAIGAAAALMALAVLDSRFLTLDTSLPGVTYLFAFAAGYSERFIVGAIEKMNPGKKSD